MRKNKLVFCLIIGVFFASGLWAYQSLGYAHRQMDRGDFYGARNAFIDISRYGYASERREAAYFVGFCSVKMHDPWQAISDFRWFLDRFDNGNRKYIPDALYVLGRTYEDTGNMRSAKHCYRDCINRFPFGEFANKSRERLNQFGYLYSMNFSIEGVPDNSKTIVDNAAKKKTEKASSNDPFDGFKLDQDKVKRVNSFLKAVQEMKDVDKAVKGLTTDDSHLSVVKENIKKLLEKRKFDNLHKTQ